LSQPHQSAYDRFCRRKASELFRENERLTRKIAELQQAQENILRAKLEWERTFDAVPDLIAIIDQDYRLQRINQALAQRLGIDFQQALGQRCYQLICGADQPPPFCPYLKCLATGGERVMGLEASILGRDFSLTFAPTIDQQGRVKGGVHVFHDITERKDHEKSLRENWEKLRRIISSMPVMLHAHDEQGDLVFWNQECERVTGYSFEEMVEVSDALRLLYPDPRQYREVDKLIKRKGEFRNLEIELTGKGGAQKTVSWSNISQQFSIQGWDSWAVGLDITERKQAEEETKRLEKRLQMARKMEALGTLAGGITHDFSNYLSVILGCLQMAIADISPGHPCLSHLNLALKASNNAKNLVRQILSFSRHSQTQKYPIRLDAVLKEGINFLRASLPSFIKISSNIPEDPGLVLADQSEIQQLIINLGTNAAHAMQNQDGQITISMSRLKIREDDDFGTVDLTPGPYYLITFADNGAGMKPETMERIFDPFFTTKKSGEGTGMGLAVVHGIVKNCGGEILVSSRLGRGTTFRVFLPAMDTGDEKQESESTPPANGSERILLVDDDNEVLYVASHLLKKLGYQVTSVDSGEEALDIFRNDPNKFDLLLTDQVMPHFSGTDLVRYVLDIKPDLAFIIMTGLKDKIWPEEDYEFEIKHFILKPFGEAQMAKVVREALRAEPRDMP
jgi:PAS domain S-box-containing protein